VLGDELRIHWLCPKDTCSGLGINPVLLLVIIRMTEHVPLDIFVCVELSITLLLSVHYDFAVVWVNNYVRIFLFHNQLEIEDLSFVPRILWSEGDSVGRILEVQELGVWLAVHCLHIYLWLVISFLINKRWESVLKDFAYSKTEGCINFPCEIWVVVVLNLNIEIKFVKVAG
jgi:hypothetical protein